MLIRFLNLLCSKQAHPKLFWVQAGLRCLPVCLVYRTVHHLKLLRFHELKRTQTVSSILDNDSKEFGACELCHLTLGTHMVGAGAVLTF